MAYTTVADLKTYMGGISGSGDDTLLGDLIDQAKAIIDSKYNRTFEAAADSTRYFHAVEDVDGYTLLIDEDLCAITSITNGDGTTVSSSDYTVVPKNDPPWFEIRLKLSADTAWTYSTTPEDAISVVGKWAYSTTPPDDIVFLCLRMASWMYRARKGEYDRAQVSPTGQMLLPSKLVNEIEALRPKYARKALAR